MEGSLPEEHTGSQRGKVTQRSRILQRPSEIVTCVTPAPGIDGLSEARSILVDVIRTAREEVGKVICISVLSQQGRDVSAFRCIPHILHIVSAQQILPAWMNNWSAC